MTTPTFAHKIRLAYSQREKELKLKRRQLKWQLAGTFISCFLLAGLLSYVRSYFIFSILSFVVLGIFGYLLYRWGKRYGKIQSELNRLHSSYLVHHLNSSGDMEDSVLYFRRD